MTKKDAEFRKGDIEFFSEPVYQNWSHNLRGRPRKAEIGWLISDDWAKKILFYWDKKDRKKLWVVDLTKKKKRREMPVGELLNRWKKENEDLRIHNAILLGSTGKIIWSPRD